MDPWVPSMNSLKPQPNSNNLPIDTDMKVSELALEEPRRWNSLLLQTLFKPESVITIMKIPLSTLNFKTCRDKAELIHHASDNFSVKSTYAALQGPIVTTQTQHTSTTWKNLWRLKLHDKLKLFL